MVRKLILGTVAAAAVAIGFGASEAKAAPPIVLQPGTGGFVPQHGYPHRHDHDYVVYVRHGHHWDRYGRFETRWQAERAVRQLEYQGHQAYYRVVEDRRW